MLYQVKYSGGRCCNFANSSKDLIQWLKLLKDETITDIRKVYKTGYPESVMGTYKKSIGNEKIGKERSKSDREEERNGAVLQAPGVTLRRLAQVCEVEEVAGC